MYRSYEDVSLLTTSIKDDINGIAFPITAGVGGYFSKSSGFTTLLAGLKQLLLTTKGERVMSPEFGTNLRRFVFRQNTPELRNEIKEEVETAMAIYEPRLKIKEFNLVVNDDLNRNAIYLSMRLSLTGDYLQERILEILI
jgi:hypothetical protein